MSFGRVRSILAGSYIFLGGFGPFWRVQSYVIHCTSEFNRHRQTDRQTDNIESLERFDKPIGASPRMFSVELWCTGSCFGHAGMVHRGGSINSYGIACSIAIPPLAVGRSVSLINEL